MTSKELVTIVFKDAVTAPEGNEIEHTVSEVAAAIPVSELKKTAQSFLKNGEEQNILLYIGTLCLEDEQLLSAYNKSKRSKLTVSIVREVRMTITVKTLQRFGTTGGKCLFVPLWAFVCRDTMRFQMAAHDSIGSLRQKIVDEMGDPEKLPYDKIEIVKGRKRLKDNAQTLRAAELNEGTIITLFVPMCYRKKAKKQDSGLPPGGEKNEEGEKKSEHEEGDKSEKQEGEAD